MGYETQITAYEAKRAALAANMESIITESDAKGETLDGEQDEEFKTLEGQIKAVDAQLERYRTLEGLSAAKSVPVEGYTPEGASTTRGGERVVVKAQPKLEGGIEFTRLFKSLAVAEGDAGRAAKIAEARYGADSNAVGTLKGMEEKGQRRLAWDGQEKGNIVAGSTIAGTWAADLVLDEGGSFADFAEYLRPATILGKFGANGVPSLRRIPFRTALGVSTTGGAGYWVGEGLAKPLTSFNFDKTFLEPLKCANIAVLTEELLRSSAVSAEALIRDELVNALVELIDVAFIDPTNAGTANVKPASISNGAVSIAASSGGDADDIRLDVRNLLQIFINNNMEGTSPVLVMRTGDALGASFLVNALGGSEFPNMGMNGGSILGIPVVTSQNVPSGTVVAVQPSEIYLADDGGFMVDVSNQASLLMTTDANANHNSITPTGTSLVSMFQTNSVAFRAERILNWSKRRANATVILSSAAWGGATNT